jgi:hypothetical protein
LTAVEDAREVGVAERGGTNDVVTKGSTNLFVRRKVGEENFDDDESMQGQVLSDVHLGRLTDAEHLANSVATGERVVG